jgi:hypothetical protein
MCEMNDGRVVFPVHTNVFGAVGPNVLARSPAVRPPGAPQSEHE